MRRIGLLVAGPGQQLAKLLEAEIGAKLEQPVTLNLSAAQSVELRGLGRATGSLVQAGMRLEDALVLAGLDASNPLTP